MFQYFSNITTTRVCLVQNRLRDDLNKVTFHSVI